MSGLRRIRVVAAVVERDGRILIARRRPGGPFGGKWEFPGGKVRDGESDAEALARELREETACTVRVRDLLEEVDHDYPELRVCLAFYRCDLEVGCHPRAHDHDRLAWVEPADLGRYDFLEADLPLVARLSGRP
jgi:8-oxo-dGTP diphosphatase